jgi:hypothetical protein
MSCKFRLLSGGSEAGPGMNDHLQSSIMDNQLTHAVFDIRPGLFASPSLACIIIAGVLLLGRPLFCNWSLFGAKRRRRKWNGPIREISDDVNAFVFGFAAHGAYLSRNGFSSTFS